jgi:hypothetical protein
MIDLTNEDQFGFVVKRLIMHVFLFQLNPHGASSILKEIIILNDMLKKKAESEGFEPLSPCPVVINCLFV